MKHLFLSKVGALHCRRAYGRVSEQLFAFAGSVLYLCLNEIQLGKVAAVQWQGETEILLCLLTNRERSPMSQAESCGGGTDE